ncbi:alpha/beta hydrolase [Aquisalimonas sp. 2447]|uniref:alpha/beta hydrolase n=1 Tax=Aquisalimonas sp. 2447 TaxID=2740807 RepID=UPI00143242EC|nr:alpha/beta hydrolase [Aquisalimonas sp. 2447]QIT56811.1 alpha/beta hydrolase [Aquisalimonas sp. 2447]
MGVITVIALTGLGLYLGLMLLLYGMQSRLIHLPGVPGRELMATPADIGLQWEDVQLRTADDVSLHGWYLPAPEDGAGYTVVFFHGNAGNISHRLDSLEIFHDLGLATLIIDYRGYGRSEGSPSEDGLYRDGDAAWRYLVDERGVSPGEIIAFGRSLGAAVAARVASERDVGGVILESAFTSAPDRGAELYPIFPVRLLARIHYPTRDYIRDVEVPVLVVHSPEDEIIPIHHGRAVYDAAPEPRQFLEISGDHNTGFLQSREEYTRGIAEWLRTLER